MIHEQLIDNRQSIFIPSIYTISIFYYFHYSPLFSCLYFEESKYTVYNGLKNSVVYISLLSTSSLIVHNYTDRELWFLLTKESRAVTWETKQQIFNSTTVWEDGRMKNKWKERKMSSFSAKFIVEDDRMCRKLPSNL
jgi:hypothetical protein